MLDQLWLFLSKPRPFTFLRKSFIFLLVNFPRPEWKPLLGQEKIFRIVCRTLRTSHFTPIKQMYMANIFFDQQYLGVHKVILSVMKCL